MVEFGRRLAGGAAHGVAVCGREVASGGLAWPRQRGEEACQIFGRFNNDFAPLNATLRMATDIRLQQPIIRHQQDDAGAEIPEREYIEKVSR